jgi:ArsR family transcriptional regulator
MDKNFNETCEEEVVHSASVEKVRAEMDEEELLYEVAELFKVFGDSTRTKILSALTVMELCVCDIAEVLNMTKSAVSHQLRILRQTKIVKSRRSGKEVYYSLDDEHISDIYALAIEHLKEN